MSSSETNLVGKTERGLVINTDNMIKWVTQVVLVVKDPPANAGDRRDVDLIPGLGRSPGEGHGNPL